MTRRELLACLGALPLASLFSGCEKGAPPLPEGEIIGQSDAFGHRLQQGWRPEVAPRAWEQTPVLIVGGGVAGLSAAWRLQKAGFSDFILLELESEPGGTSRSGRSPISAFPWGAHYLPAPQKENRALIRLLKEMNVVEGEDAYGEPAVGEQYLCAAPQERIAYKGRWYEGLYLHAGATAEDLRQWAAFQKEAAYWIGWHDAAGRRAFSIPTAGSSASPEATALDGISMAEFLDKRGLNSSRLRWHVEYACRDDYGSLLADTSAWAGLFYFASRVKRPGEEAEPLITWPEGNGRLVDHLYQNVKDRTRLGVAAAEIVPQEKDRRSWVDVSAFDRRTQRAVGFRAQRVIFAAPQFLAAHLLRPFRDAPPAYIRDFQYAPWLVANLSLREPPAGLGFPLCWDNVLYESPSLGYVVATHQDGSSRGPTVLTYYYAFCDHDTKAARARLLAGSWQHWAELILAELALVHPEFPALVERLDVMRWGHAMIRPSPGFIWGSSRQKAAAPFRNIHFAHTDLSGVALFEEAFYHGLRAAEEVLASFGRPPAERYL
jgi:phytoene dehydrogenase-like protein